jgi:hypothetical protein
MLIDITSKDNISMLVEFIVDSECIRRNKLCFAIFYSKFCHISF